VGNAPAAQGGSREPELTVSQVAEQSNSPHTGVNAKITCQGAAWLILEKNDDY